MGTARTFTSICWQGVAKLRGEMPPAPPPQLRVDLTGRIPIDYVPEPNLRQFLCRRLARMAEFEDELADCFGPVPLASLLALVRLRLLCTRIGIARLDAGPRAAALTRCNPANARRLADALGGCVREGRAILDISEPRTEVRVNKIIRRLQNR